MDRILIIDDSELELRILTDILKERYEIATAKTGEDGLVLAAEFRPSLILLDIVMRGMDGFAILKRLKEDPLISHIPVVFLTGLTDERTEEKGLLEGAVDYIKKPYNSNIVRARVRNQVEAYRHFRAIELQMSVDSLTGVKNRNDFEKMRGEICRRLLRERNPLCVLMLDIDFFKRVNDTYGHAEGDDVLRRLAEEIRNWFEPDGYVARYGGEEFVILLPEEIRSAAERAERFCRAVRALKIPNKNSEVCPYLTVSIGICEGWKKTVSEEEGTGGRKAGNTAERPCSPEAVFDAEAYVDLLVKRADEALYEAKKNGRNQVRWKKLTCL